MSIKSQAARRRNSYVEIASNPLEGGGSEDSPRDRKLEILSDCTRISLDGMASMKSIFTDVSTDNTQKLKELDCRKSGYLFASSDLIVLLDLVPSIKTQIAMIEIIGPRLTDPKQKAEDITNRFRFSEEKRVVQDVLKSRAHTLGCNMYGSSKASVSMGSGSRSQAPIKMNGRAGRGMRRVQTSRATASRSEPPVPVSIPSVHVSASSSTESGGALRRAVSDEYMATGERGDELHPTVESVKTDAVTHDASSSTVEDISAVDEAPTAIAEEIKSVQKEVEKEPTPDDPQGIEKSNKKMNDSVVEHDALSTMGVGEEAVVTAAPVREEGETLVEKMESEVTESSPGGPGIPGEEDGVEASSISVAEECEVQTTPSVLPISVQAEMKTESVSLSVGETGQGEGEGGPDPIRPQAEKKEDHNVTALPQTDVHSANAHSNTTAVRNSKKQDSCIIAEQEAFTFDDRFQEDSESVTECDSVKQEPRKSGLLSSILQRMPFGRK